MTTLRWPDGRGKFVDDDTDRTPNGERLEVFPGAKISVEDDDAAAHYQERGFVVVDGDGADLSADADDSVGPADGGGEADTDSADGGSDESGGFDAQAFANRTPVSDVVDDIEAGEADGHLDAVKEADDRVTVEAAVEDRKEAIGGD